MPHDPHNRYCHYPSLACICDGSVGFLPIGAPDPSIAPALLAWWDAERPATTIDVQTAWQHARPLFAETGSTDAFPQTPGDFADLLAYAEPLFAKRRSVRFDLTDAASDGVIGVIATSPELGGETAPA